jgi:hypothetical protein
MTFSWRSALAAVAFALPLGAHDIVINEVMYHPPGDHQNLQFIELFNKGSETVDLSGWAFSKGVKFTFPDKTELKPGGFLVIPKDLVAFAGEYGRNIHVIGPFEGRLPHKGERLELISSKGAVVESLKFQDHAPWPAGADGYGASLERICPDGPVDDPSNWACSRIPQFERSTGTPGRQNDSHAGKILPAVREVIFKPVSAGADLTVRARVADPSGLKSVSLLYRVVSTGNPGSDKSVGMRKVASDAKGDVFEGVIPSQKAGTLVRFRIKAIANSDQERISPDENDIRPSFTWYSHSGTNTSKIPEAVVVRTGTKEPSTGRFAGSKPSLSARGGAAFVYLRPGGSEAEVFDHVRISPRHGGFKVRFHKDQTLRGMSVVNIISEGPPRWLLSEALAYELYRLAGVPAELTEHIRVTLDGRQIGYQLLIEQPNKAFLERNKRDTSGDLFKLLWYGNGVVGKHEKKTNPTTGHEELIKTIDRLNKTSEAEQWDYIQKNINVDEFVNYYAVNMCIQNWDGFFNNFYLYQDKGGTGKWEIYPWDEDKTWGDYDGASSSYDWYEMPLTYGSKGDRSPRELKWLLTSGPFGGASWWRPPGYFSGPLLANPEFRAKFLRRVKELCETVFTEERFYPVIKAMETRLEPEIARSARAEGDGSSHALKRFHSDILSFENQVKHRRKFLLAELEKELKP